MCCLQQPRQLIRGDESHVLSSTPTEDYNFTVVGYPIQEGSQSPSQARISDFNWRGSDPPAAYEVPHPSTAVEFA